MKVDHVFEEQLYLISSHSVAKNPLFNNKSHCQRFLEKIEKYLSPLCDILDYCLLHNQFQLIVRLKSRDTFVEFYRDKTEDEDIPRNYIPFTTHIFSQAVSNLLSSTAIWYNRKYNRTGALFARRFTKTLIESEKALRDWIANFHDLVPHHKYAGMWALEKGMQKKIAGALGIKGSGEISKLNYTVNGKGYSLSGAAFHPIINSMNKYKWVDLEGQFNYHVPKTIYGPLNQILEPVPRI